MSKIEILAPVASLVSIHLLKARTVSVTGCMVHVYMQHGTSVCWHIKTWLESGPVTADQTTQSHC